MKTVTAKKTRDQTHFDMVGKAHTYIIDSPGVIAKETVARLYAYGARRFRRAGIDVSQMPCTVEENETTGYFSVHFTNEQGTVFIVNSILWSKKTRSVVVDHGLSMEE